MSFLDNWCSLTTGINTQPVSWAVGKKSKKTIVESFFILKTFGLSQDHMDHIL